MLLGLNCWTQNIINIPSPIDSLRRGTNYFHLTEALDSYWEQQDSDVQGSGIKPYLRWKERWRNDVRPNGTIKSPYEIIESRLNIQKRTKSTSQRNANWIPLGPADVFNLVDEERNSGLGRLNVVEVDPNDPNTIYVGSPGGGVWKSYNNGDTWEDLSYNLPAIGISGIAVDYNNSDIIYVTSGDEDGFTNAASGVYKSIDGGVTWSATGTLTPLILGEIYINPDDSDMLWLVSWDGIFRTTDGGDNWSLVVSGLFKEIRIKPSDPNTIYAVRDNFSNTDLYISNDAGATFRLAHTFTNIGGRTVIAVTPANPEYLYIMLSNNDNTFNSIRLSEDSGNSFSIINQTEGVYYSNQSWFDLALAVSEIDPQKIYMGCLILHRSLDYGHNIESLWSSEWEKGEPYDFHVDIHDIKIFNGIIYVASDGGLYLSKDQGYTFRIKSAGLNISQVYRLDVAQGLGSKVVGGLQDNGGFAFSDNNWYRYNNADGMDAAIDPSGEKGYGLTQFGNNMRIFNFIDNSMTIVNPGVLGGNWVTPLEMGNGGTLYAGSDHIYRLDDNQKWSPVNNQEFTDIRNIRVDPDNDQRILLDNTTDELFLSDGTKDMMFFRLNPPTGGWLSYNGIVNFDFNRKTGQIIYVLTGTSIFLSNDSGESYTDITGSIPSSETKVGIIHQANSDNNSLYLATTHAVYYKNDDMDDWELFNLGLPPMQISDIEINNVENHILVSSFGKGVWRSPVHDDALTIIQETNESPQLIYPNPVQDAITIDFDLKEPSEILIYDINGTLLHTFQKSTILRGERIKFESYPSGTYILRIISKNHHINIKVLKS